MRVKGKESVQPDGSGRALIGVALAALLLGLLAVGIHTTLKGNPLGGDFYVFWNAGRAFFFERADPYSEAVTRQVQMGYYHGRLAAPGEDPMKFAYPAYALAAVLPLLSLPFDWAQSVWMAFNILLLLAMLLVVLPSRQKWLAGVVLFLYPVVFGLILGNFVTAIFAVLLGVLYALLLDRMDSIPLQIGAGLLLAWVTAKPQFVWFYLLFILLYSLQRKYRALLGSFFFGLAALGGLSLAVRSDWPQSWLRRVTEYTGYLPLEPVLKTMTRFLVGEPGLQLGLGAAYVLTLGLLTFLLVGWWRGKFSDLLVLSWGGFAVYLLHPTGTSYEQLAFILPLVLWTALTSPRPLTTALGWIGALVLSYIFFTMAVLKIAPWADHVLPFVLYAIWLAWFTQRNRHAAWPDPRQRPAV